MYAAHIIVNTRVGIHVSNRYMVIIDVFWMQMQFDVELMGEFDFSKCRRFAVRGYNKAKLMSAVSVDVKSCEAFDPILIKPKHVLDAVGKRETDRGIYLFVMKFESL